MEFDPQAFQGTAQYYAAGRPPYSEQLAATMRRELSLDGTGQLLDVGCGPGVVVLELAGLFSDVVAVDPVADMLDEGRHRCEQAGISHVRWVRATAEGLGELGLDPCRVITFAQSFHRVRQVEVADACFDLLEPGGSMVLISHALDGRPRPVGPAHPSIPYDAIRDLVIDYLGEGTRHYLDTWSAGMPARFEDTLATTRFAGSRTVYAPGRPRLIRDVDTVVANCFSRSYSAPRLFGERRAEFEADLRRLLVDHSPSGYFWEWPGDTELVMATKR